MIEMRRDIISCINHYIGNFTIAGFIGFKEGNDVENRYIQKSGDD
jgi:hypothetical protein